MKQYNISEDKIFVLTYKKINEAFEMVVFDIEGGFLEKKMVHLPHLSFTEPVPYTINNYYIYYLLDNNNTEEWELHRIKF